MIASRGLDDGGLFPIARSGEMEGREDENRGEDEQDAVAAGAKHGGPSHPSGG
jgi:hypothetical protein